MSDTSSHKPAPVSPSESPPPGEPTSPDGSGSHGSASRGSSSRGSSDGQATIISARSPTGGVSLGQSPPPLESANLLEGERLGQFLLQKFIGGGGMGVVFRALDTTLNREVAVKVLSRDQSADEEALRRFRNEAQSAARLNHENIARVHYVGEDRGVHYIVFEFIEGTNLRDRVEQTGPLPLAEAISYTYQIAQALDHASQRDVIHRDIKPSNVLITPDGKAKLVDMGLARLIQVAQADHDLTASGVTLGTFDYISPEQARDPRSADVRSDLYSLGCSFFYMLTGRPPFPEGTVLQKLLQHQADHPPDPRALRPELPAEVTWILARLLAKNPAQRFQQPHELAEHLAALGEKLGLHLSAPPATWAQPRPDGMLAHWRPHLPWAVPLAALLLIVLALDSIWSAAEVSPQIAGPPAVSAPAKLLPNPLPPPEEAVPAPLAPPRASRSEPGGTPSTATLQPQQQLPQPPSAAETSEPKILAPKPEGSDEARPAPSPLLEQFAKRVGASLNIEELAARAAAAADAAARLEASPAGAPRETGVSGADAAATQPPANGAAARTGGAREGLLIVSDTEKGAQVYATLRAACNNAKSGDVIELRYNGRALEEPLTISNTNLTIRGGSGFRPVVVFRPEPNPVKFPPSMVSIAGGQLQASDVHWELDLPRDVPGDWALFETRRAELVRFERCSFTVRNASLGHSSFHAGVAFFDIKAPPGGSTMAMPPAAAGEDASVTIDLQDCVARGEASFVRDNELQPLRLHWDNGLLATSERLLVAAGGPAEPRQAGYVQINLRHVTAVFRGGLALLTNSEDAPYQLVTEFQCSDSILASTSNGPLIEQRGSNSLDDYRARLQWSGDRNFFDGVEVFWKIVTGATQTTAAQMDFDQWREVWSARSRQSTSGPIAWKRLPSTARPFHTHTPDDYALDESAQANPAIGGASDGLDAGVLVGRLGSLPPEVAEPLDTTDSNDD
jgi:serine/threonine-protein kinase